jgi:hypothetical protein
VLDLEGSNDSSGTWVQPQDVNEPDNVGARLIPNARQIRDAAISESPGAQRFATVVWRDPDIKPYAETQVSQPFLDLGVIAI